MVLITSFVVVESYLFIYLFIYFFFFLKFREGAADIISSRYGGLNCVRMCMHRADLSRLALFKTKKKTHFILIGMIEIEIVYRFLLLKALPSITLFKMSLCFGKVRGTNSPFSKDCLFVKIIVFGNKIITLLMKINCLVSCAT